MRGAVLAADSGGIVLTGLRDEDRGTVDVFFDGRRIWSTRVEPDQRGTAVLPWPESLARRLSGTATLRVTRTGTEDGVELEDVRFGDDDSRIDLRSPAGTPLSVNKWGHLQATIAGAGFHDALLDSTERLIDDLRGLGYRPYITGGTLLGAVREGDLLPHDDDADLGYLSEQSHPSDLCLESFGMQRALEARGYRIVRHSGVHIQVTFEAASGETEFYVDVFTAFYREGEFCQPIAVRGDFARDRLEPLTSVSARGRALPAPADPEGWLALCYGPSWAVPDPAFRFETPLETRRRFENWFGEYNVNRVFWESAATDLADARPGEAELQAFDDLTARIPTDAAVLDLGCGNGLFTARLARRCVKVLGVDYSDAALREARRRESAGLAFDHLNLNDRRMLLNFVIDRRREGGRWHVNAHHLLEGMHGPGRENAFLLMRLLLTPDTFAAVTVDTELGHGYSPLLPDTWHLTLEGLDEEAGRAGLTVEVVEEFSRPTPSGPRAAATAVLRPRSAATRTTRTGTRTEKEQP